MTDIDTLTDEDRREIQCGTADRDVRWKALRIIGQLTEALGLERADSEEIVGKMAVEITRLTEALAAAERQLTARFDAYLSQFHRAEAAEARNQELAERIQRDGKSLSELEAKLDAAEATQRLNVEYRERVVTAEHDATEWRRVASERAQEVTRLTEALDQERCERVQLEEHESAECARLTEALATAEQGVVLMYPDETHAYLARAVAAEARVRELEAQGLCAVKLADRRGAELAQLRDRVRELEGACKAHYEARQAAEEERTDADQHLSALHAEFDKAEARCRELQDDLAREVAEGAVALTELAQLRERVAKAVRILASKFNTHEQACSQALDVLAPVEQNRGQ